MAELSQQARNLAAVFENASIEPGDDCDVASDYIVALSELLGDEEVILVMAKAVNSATTALIRRGLIR